MFDEFLARDAERAGPVRAVRRRTRTTDAYVDGKKREDGVRAFLASRGISCPTATPDDDPDAETVNGLGNRKNETVPATSCRPTGVEVFEGSRRYLEAAREGGLRRRRGVVERQHPRGAGASPGSTSTSQQRVDGVTMRDRGHRGQARPGLVPARREAARRRRRHEAVVFEDALAGVEAGRAGHFGFVVGVDRVGQAEALRRNGADVVVTDLAELMDGR